MTMDPVPPLDARARRLDSPARLAELPSVPGWPDVRAARTADAAFVVEGPAGIRARAAVWWNGTPPLDGIPVGAVGCFGASDREAALLVLDAACEALRARGCVQAVGPMDGSTWRRYRLVTERGTEPPFLMEPWNPPEWPGWFADSGFAPVAHYHSGVADLSVRDEVALAAERRLRARGVSLRRLDLGRFDEELERIHELALEAFAEAFLFTPIGAAEFAALYAEARGILRPELVLVAEDAGRPAGFVFAVPDALEMQREGRARTAIVKTVAIRADRERYAGLGGWLVAAAHDAARALGFERMIHALMHESNRSRKISSRTGGELRRYALFGRTLAP